MASPLEMSAFPRSTRFFILWRRVIRSISSWPNASWAFPLSARDNGPSITWNTRRLTRFSKTIDRTTLQGSRDYALLATMFNTGGRVQEIADLRACDLQLTKPFQVRLFGKGRKERYCPLWPQTAAVLRAFSDQRTLDLRSESRCF